MACVSRRTNGWPGNDKKRHPCGQCRSFSQSRLTRSADGMLGQAWRAGSGLQFACLGCCIDESPITGLNFNKEGGTFMMLVPGKPTYIDVACQLLCLPTLPPCVIPRVRTCG